MNMDALKVDVELLRESFEMIRPAVERELVRLDEMFGIKPRPIGTPEVVQFLFAAGIEWMKEVDGRLNEHLSDDGDA